MVGEEERGLRRDTTHSGGTMTDLTEGLVDWAFQNPLKTIGMCMVIQLSYAFLLGGFVQHYCG